MDPLGCRAYPGRPDLRTALIPLLWAASQGLAQLPVITLYSDELARQPAEILVSSGYQTYLEFFDLVEKAGYQQDGPYTITTQDNFVIITTRAQSGSGDLWVRVQGRTHFFNLRTQKGTSLRPYRIERERPPRASPTSQKLALPATVTVQLLATPPVQGETVVQYLFRNNSSFSLTIQLGQLRAHLNDQPRIPRLLYGQSSLVLPPGSLAAGAFSLPGSGPFNLEWSLPEVGSSRIYTYQQTLLPAASPSDPR